MSKPMHLCEIDIIFGPVFFIYLIKAQTNLQAFNHANTIKWMIHEPKS